MTDQELARELCPGDPFGTVSALIVSKLDDNGKQSYKRLLAYSKAVDVEREIRNSGGFVLVRPRRKA